MSPKLKVSHHHWLIATQAQKVKRSNYWKPITAWEVAYIFTIIWYIKVELVRTKQLPTYMTFSQLDRVPALKKDIQSQALLVYDSVFRGGVERNKFCLANTGDAKVNGNVGIVTSYDSINSSFNTKSCSSNVWV